jgi:hypothetical protein
MTTSDYPETNKNEIDSEWFGDSAHYWTDESLRFAYTFACVDVAIKKSVKVKNLYIKIIESWNNTNLTATFKDFYDEMTGCLSDEDKGKIQEAFRFPERFIEKDFDKQLKTIQNVTHDEQTRDYILGILDKPELVEKHGEYPEIAEFIASIFEFVLIGFNRKADVENGEYRVFPGDNNSWLLHSVMYMTAMMHYKLTMGKIIQMYKVRIYRKKIVNFENVLCKQPTSRMHRRITVDAKKAKLYLMHDAKVYQTAERWYQCRVACSGIEDYCNKQAIKGIMLDSKNVSKEIRPCDEAMGYSRENKGKSKT